MLNVAIVGAGPYGLSIAAHFRRHDIPYRIFGRPMDSWLAHMPKGMMLKSDGFASNIYDPDREFTLRQFCADRGIKYADTGVPVNLDTFAAYGLAFMQRMAPEVEDRMVEGLDFAPGGFRLRLERGEILRVRQIVLAVGITHFSYVPEALSALGPEFVSHSFDHHEISRFRGQGVVVVGGGASALDLAGLLRDSDAEVQLVARKSSLKFHTGPPKQRSLWKRVRHPQSGLGPGLRSCFFADAPAAFYYIPQALRLHLVRTTLGPSGGWFIRDKVMGRLPLWLGQTIQDAKVKNGKVSLRLHAVDGVEHDISTEHVIAATGYRVDMERLRFLSPEIRARMKSVNGSPVLSPSFESSVPGLFFAGVAAANSFGPVMRFAFGAGFAARTITRAMLNRRAAAPLPAHLADEDAARDDQALEEQSVRS